MDWLLAFEHSLSEACNDLIESLPVVPMQYVNESVFRYFLIRRLLETNRDQIYDIEWKRWDLMFVSQSGGKIPVEIKFWCHHGERSVQRGGPSAQNEREFRQVVEKLHDARNSKSLSEDGVESCWLVLVYADLANPGRARAFGDSYEDLAMIPHLKQVRIVKDKAHCETNTRLTCKLIEVGLGPTRN